MNAKLIKEQMEAQQWLFRSFVDEKQKHRFIGKFEDYGCLIDLKTDKVEYWNYNYDFWIDYNPDTFSQDELELALLTCDCCGLTQEKIEDLQLVNVSMKYCKKCCENNL